MDLTKPLPQASPTSQPVWDGLKERVVRLQQCEDCSSWIFYPRTHCSNCLSPHLTWKTVAGTGVLYTYTVTHQPTAPHFQDEVPQLLAVVELDEGVRLTSTLSGIKPEDVVIGMRLKPYFDERSEDVTMLRFQPA